MKQMQNVPLVMPGDFISTSEEYDPGPGVYEEDGNLYASQTGRLLINHDEFTAQVKPVTSTIIDLQPGMEVIGQINRMKESAVVMQVVAVVGHGTRVEAELEATLHVSKVAREYVDRLRDRFRLLDTVRARVLSVEPSLQVETAYREGGVVSALCGQCRQPLGFHHRKLRCQRCERTEYRQLSAAFGQAVS